MEYGTKLVIIGALMGASIGWSLGAIAATELAERRVKKEREITNRIFAIKDKTISMCKEAMGIQE